jgi:hypothetical protein
MGLIIISKLLFIYLFIYIYLFEKKVPSFMKEWINIKTAYARHYQKRRPPAGMKNMLAELEIPLEGHHHYGLHDCRNIAKVKNIFVVVSFIVVISLLFPLLLFLLVVSIVSTIDD